MTFQQLKYIVSIVEFGSITEAAKQLFISQPSLSNAVKELETELNIEIFKRSSRGISLSHDGREFLSYARQVLEQADLLENRYKNKKASKQLCSISTQHYAFAVNAFSNLIKKIDNEEYEFTLRETRTHEIIEDVRDFRSEIGILYLNDFNQKVIEKFLVDGNLKFTPLFSAQPHVFISAHHPLAMCKKVTTDDLASYAFLSFEQGTNNSFYFSEEILSTLPRKKVIHVSDRATLFNLLIGLDGYTICTGVLNTDLNGSNIVSVPLVTDEKMTVGYITNSKINLSLIAKEYLDELKKLIVKSGYKIL